MAKLFEIPIDKFELLKTFEQHIEFIGFENLKNGYKPLMKIRESEDCVFESFRTSQPQDIGSVIFAFQAKLIEVQIANYKRDIENSKDKFGLYPSKDPIDKRESFDNLYLYSKCFVAEMIKTKLCDSIKLAA